MKQVLGLAAALALLGCGKDDKKDEKAEPKEKAAPPREVAGEPVAKEKKPPKESPNEVDLTFSGGITATLKGKGGVCDKGMGAHYGVRSAEFGVSPDFELTILVTGEDEWADPKVILNVTEPRASYARSQKRPEGDKVELARDLTLATIDTVLAPVGGTGDVTVKGTIKCPPKAP